MPLYEYRENATNFVPSSEEVGKSLSRGKDAVLSRLLDEAVSRSATGATAILAIDGWYGVDFDDLISREKLSALKERIEQNKSNGSADVYALVGPGAASDGIADEADVIAYADFTMQPMLWQMWGGELVPFGRFSPQPDYYWKKYYYCDFYLLYRQKKAVFESMHFYIDAVGNDDIKMLPSAEYNRLIDDLVKQPIKQVKILQPGPWGAYRYRDLWQVEGLDCNAWNELAGIELSILVNVGGDSEINMPAQNIM